jgi:hypothetical protein
MKKSVTALVTSAAIGAAVIAGAGPAQARWGGWHGGWHGGWWGPGPVVGGLLAGAIIGTALASPYYPYGFVGPYPYGPPYGPCAWRAVWNGYRWVRACY